MLSRPGIHFSFFFILALIACSFRKERDYSQAIAKIIKKKRKDNGFLRT